MDYFLIPREPERDTEGLKRKRLGKIMEDSIRTICAALTKLAEWFATDVVNECAMSASGTVYCELTGKWYQELGKSEKESGSEDSVSDQEYGRNILAFRGEPDCTVASHWGDSEFDHAAKFHCVVAHSPRSEPGQGVPHPLLQSNLDNITADIKAKCGLDEEKDRRVVEVSVVACKKVAHTDRFLCVKLDPQVAQSIMDNVKELVL